MQDELVEKIFSAIRSEKVEASAKFQAIVRAGKIAEAYLGSPTELLESVFGTLQHNLRSNDHSD
jgi:hypothetical protein